MRTRDVSRVASLRIVLSSSSMSFVDMGVCSTRPLTPAGRQIDYPPAQKSLALSMYCGAEHHCAQLNEFLS